MGDLLNVSHGHTNSNCFLIILDLDILNDVRPSSTQSRLNGVEEDDLIT